MERPPMMFIKECYARYFVPTERKYGNPKGSKFFRKHCGIYVIKSYKRLLNFKDGVEILNDYGKFIYEILHLFWILTNNYDNVDKILNLLHRAQFKTRERRIVLNSLLHYGSKSFLIWLDIFVRRREKLRFEKEEKMKNEKKNG